MASAITKRPKLDQDSRYAQQRDLFNVFSSFRSIYDPNAEDCWRLYTGYVEPLDEDDDRSNIHIPLPYESVDTWRSRLLTTFWGNQRPYVNCIPLPIGDVDVSKLAQKIQSAKLASSVIDGQFERNDIVQLMYNYYTGLLTFPFMALGVGWKYEEKVVKRRKLKRYPADAMGFLDRMVMEIEDINQVTFDDNYIQLLDYDDVWPDKYGGNIDEFRGIFIREYVTRLELESLMDNLNDITKDLHEGTVYKPDYDLEQNVLDFGGASFSKASFYGEEIDMESGYEFGSPYSLFELLHYWSDEEHYITFNRQQIIYDGPNHYWRHGKKPVVYTSFEPLPKRPIGMSAVQLIRYLADEIDTQRNQRIDYAAMVLNPMFEVAGELDESELIWRRAGIIHVNTIGQNVNKIDLGNIPQSAFVETNDTKQEAYNTLAVPDVIRGVDAGVKQTATFTAQQSSNASIRFNVKLKLWESLGLKRLAMLMDCNNQQFIDSARLVRQNWKIETVDAWTVVEPWEIEGEYDYRPAGTAVDPAANKEIKVQRMAELLPATLNDPYFKAGALRRKFVELADLTNDPSEFVKTDEELAQEQAMQRQQQDQMMQTQLAAQEEERQFQVDQANQKLIAEIVKQVIAGIMKGGGKDSTEGRVKTNEKTVHKKTQKA